MHARSAAFATFSVSALMLAVLVAQAEGGWAAESASAEDDEPVLVGLLLRGEMEAAVPDWVTAVVEARPDLEAATAMVAALAGAEVTVLLGTWCSDSGRELPRLWRAFDDLGISSPAEIRYVGVSRDKSEPAEWVRGMDLGWVPTIVVRREGSEQGRIVESSPNGIERDLLALLQGETVGVITASEEVEAAAARSPK